MMKFCILIVPDPTSNDMSLKALEKILFVKFENLRNFSNFTVVKIILFVIKYNLANYSINTFFLLGVNYKGNYKFLKITGFDIACGCYYGRLP